jgi:hypothetical protein
MDEITVQEDGRRLAFTADENLLFHSGGVPGGALHGLKAMQAASPRLAHGRPVERRRIMVLPGRMPPGFVALGANSDRAASEEARLEALQHEMAERPGPLDPNSICHVRRAPPSEARA